MPHLHTVGPGRGKTWQEVPSHGSREEVRRRRVSRAVRARDRREGTHQRPRALPRRAQRVGRAARRGDERPRHVPRGLRPAGVGRVRGAAGAAVAVRPGGEEAAPITSRARSSAISTTWANPGAAYAARARAHLTKDVLWAGAGKYAELWDMATWQREFETSDDDRKAIAARLAELGL